MEEAEWKKNFRGYKEGKFEHSKLIHRQIAYEHIYLKNRKDYPLPFTKYVVHHRDRDKENNEVANLDIVTMKEHNLIHKLDLEDKDALVEYVKGLENNEQFLDIYLEYPTLKEIFPELKELKEKKWKEQKEAEREAERIMEKARAEKHEKMIARNEKKAKEEAKREEEKKAELKKKEKEKEKEARIKERRTKILKQRIISGVLIIFIIFVIIYAMNGAFSLKNLGIKKDIIKGDSIDIDVKNLRITLTNNMKKDVKVMIMYMVSIDGSLSSERVFGVNLDSGITTTYTDKAEQKCLNKQCKITNLRYGIVSPNGDVDMKVY